MVSSKGYETTAGDNGETLYMVGDEWVTETEAREYAQAEADALAAQGDPGAYEGYPAEIAPTAPTAGYPAEIAPTEKQTVFRAKLIRELLYKSQVPQAMPSDDMETWKLDIRGDRRLGVLAFVLALPEPATKEDCSEQIDSLKLGSALPYARAHREWGQAVQDRVRAAYAAGRPDCVPLSELRAIARGDA